MRVALVASVIAPLLVSAAQAGPYIQANDTGGMIAWSCEAEAAAFDIASARCAFNNKYARITSVTRGYGNFIAYQCLWSPDKARYAIPAVRTRSACVDHASGLHVKY
jgi:hypothetical protein